MDTRVTKRSTDFLYNIWIEPFSLVDKINPNMKHYITENTEVNEFISPAKNWDTNPLVNILPNHIISKIKAILIPMSNIKDRLICLMVNFLLKT